MQPVDSVIKAGPLSTAPGGICSRSTAGTMTQPKSRRCNDTESVGIVVEPVDWLMSAASLKGWYCWTALISTVNSSTISEASSSMQ